MQAIMDSFQVEDAYWCHQATTFQFHFMLHLVVDMFVELNRMNQNFENDLVDILTFASTLIC